jgi:hypothetical protein
MPERQAEELPVRVRASAGALGASAECCTGCTPVIAYHISAIFHAAWVKEHALPQSIEWTFHPYTPEDIEDHKAF